MMHGPVFICGSPRSGTTLVSQVLNAHPDLTIFDEVNLLDIARLWERLRTPRQMAATAESPVSNTALYKAIMSTDSATKLIAELLFDEGASFRRWGEKYPDYVNNIDELHRLFPGSVMVFVVRDPRAILASMMRYKDNSARTAGDYWIVDDAASGIAVLQKSADEYIKNKTKVVTVRYESLVLEPELEIRKLCDATGLSYSADMLNPQPGALPGSAVTAQFVRNGIKLPWKNSNRSEISASIVDQWRRDYPEEFWAQIRPSLEPIMNTLGYQY
jgi:hypothetical protein